MPEVTEIKSIEPTLTAKFVRVEDGFPNVYDLPIAKNFNDGTGVVFYVNRGFIPFEKYEADRHAEEVLAKKAKEAADSEAKAKKGK